MRLSVFADCHGLEIGLPPCPVDTAQPLLSGSLAGREQGDHSPPQAPSKGADDILRYIRSSLSIILLHLQAMTLTCSCPLELCSGDLTSSRTATWKSSASLSSRASSIQSVVQSCDFSLQMPCKSIPPFHLHWHDPHFLCPRPWLSAPDAP